MEHQVSSGWFRLTILWVGTFLDHVFTQSALNAMASAVVIVLTVLQIWITWKKIKIAPETDFGDH